MKIGEVFVIGIFVFAALVLLTYSVAASGVVVDVNVTGSMNITATNDTISVISNNVTYNYTLVNASQFFSIPITMTGSREVFDVVVQGGCGVENYTAGVLNVSDNFERVVREQLVPSQNQYHSLELLRMNDSFDCQNAKNILSNEILNYRVMLNSSEIAFNATTTILNQQITVLQDDLKNWKIVAFALMFVSVFLMVYAAKGWSPRFLFDNFVNQKFIKTKSFSTGKNVQQPILPPKQPPNVGGGVGG